MQASDVNYFLFPDSGLFDSRRLPCGPLFEGNICFGAPEVHKGASYAISEKL